MTTSTEVSQTTKQEASKVTDTATDQAREVAASAKDAATGVAGTAREQASEVVSAAASQAQDLLGQAKEAVGNESDELVKRLAHNIRRLAGDLANMADMKGTPGSPANAIVGEAGSRTSALASLLESRGTQGLISEAQTYARRRPGVFLLGAAGAGLFAGRLTRALKAGPPAGQTGQRGPAFPEAPTVAPPIPGADTGATGESIDLSAATVTPPALEPTVVPFDPAIARP